MMKFNILTIFPDMITSYANESILQRGQEAQAITINPVNIRNFTEDKRKTIDDTPYGGGAGMLMKPEPIYKALKSIDAIPFAKVNGLSKVKKIFNGDIRKKKRTILMSPRGRQFNQKIAEEWSRLDELTIVCGRYEGIDQRVVDHMIDEEISVGPYVLAGGELGALTITEAVSRLVPGVLGNPDSLKEETHTLDNAEYPQYTKPQSFMGWEVPSILLSGDHKKIEEWRKK
ncbi:MAG: tRNA (guanosine(37)-N1)-methyltransferase TrmD [Candidatus Magasanikbacteria bacterium]|uniref:tRNA (guanine-N(1)-)-methyltransferase n=1 Tax=Candidatus Magasanikbacteria bacterium CG10_big_fil_rev_8_21_14_0_10_38_6 TaxID=1974647 RepID=A0A2M6P1D6_9BACT|nr:tRNA (guanosine(37)-N1)-methyltransferase TrmD [Candidatus Magasanikbacteria bacterium]NCS71926.1 tRNA (guanosine(37)-N1)-methyltransferase TrmD [Candidatus Magasanikbacteria bacterium]PIR77488.1 MAG: tRNA (guanosine(37)-N1)-methyltransferase TrmD [Candidatus Magasanikbacteria bacterium CG10_big_fil_rev_8_21_14_0_10_38_6]